VIGQPFRHKYLGQALEYFAAQRDIWLTTSDDIARTLPPDTAIEAGRRVLRSPHKCKLGGVIREKVQRNVRTDKACKFSPLMAS
jgi:hypothetical protein